MSNSITIPQAFIDSSLSHMEEEEMKRFLGSLDNPSPVSVRVNPYKLDSKPSLNGVPWSKYGFFLDNRPHFITDPFFHSGIYYVQESASMFIEHLYNHIFSDASPLKILDLCAAPGGKSTHISSLAGPGNLVVSNEVIKPRAGILKENIIKWGLGNTIVTNNDPRNFNALPEFFDLIIADVPCSGEGMFRKTPEARSEWSPGNVDMCASRQRRIISDIWGSLKKGGILIYSTCTFNQTENEENIGWITEEYDCEHIEIPSVPEWNISEGEVNGHHTFRFYPHKTNSEGLFVCALGKSGEHKLLKEKKKKQSGNYTHVSKDKIRNLSEWVEQPEYMTFYQRNDGTIHTAYRNIFDESREIMNSLNVIYSGVEMGKLYGNELKPSHSLSLFHSVNTDRVPGTNLDLEAAVNYLRKNDVDPKLFAEGINMVAYNDKPLGWIKRIGNRCNNLYPKELRIINNEIGINKDSFL
ncbi:MAG: rRNA cytosine-C5-methylase [Rikenellaceae bacterium]|nr:rRNA cytosine-C5-methylase [Rikenellaceae bacterium]